MTAREIAPDWGDEDSLDVWVQGETHLTAGQRYALEARNIGWHASYERIEWLQDLSGLDRAARQLVAEHGMHVVTVVEALSLLEERYGDRRWPADHLPATLVGIIVVRQIYRWILEAGPTADLDDFTAAAIDELGLSPYTDG